MKSSEIYHLIDKYIGTKENASVNVGVVCNSKSHIYLKSKEYGKIKENDDENTVFEIGSITKIFTSVLFSHHVLLNNISLSSKINYIVSENRLPKKVGKIKIYDLARHKSGLPRLPPNIDETITNVDNPYANYTLKHLLDSLWLTNISYRSKLFGEYSNYGYALLGYILEVISGDTYENMLKSFITSPLKMKNTSLIAQNNELIHGYNEENVQTCYWDFDSMKPAGALKSNINDMIKFMKIFWGDSVDPLSRAALFTIKNRKRTLFQTDRYLGWQCNKSHNFDFFWHDGGTGGFSSFIGIFPEVKKGLIILSNNSDNINDFTINDLGSSISGILAHS